AAVADAVADHQVVGAVDGQPAVAAVPNRGAEDVTAAHRVAAQVEVQAVAAEYAGLAEVAELGVADGPGRAAVVHRVAAQREVGRLDEEVAAEVGDGAAVVAGAAVVEVERPVERQAGAGDGADDALLGLRQVADAGAEGLLGLDLAGGGGQDHSVAG